MVTGVLAAHPVGDFFDNVVLDLLAIADMPLEETPGFAAIRLPQVHAMNCLKDIFSDTRFGSSAEPHVSDSLNISASCLDSHVYVRSLSP